MLKNIIIAVLAVAVIILGFLYIGKSANLGGFTDEYNAKVFKNTVSIEGTFGATSDVRVKKPVTTGASTTLTSGATVSITAAQVCDNSLINFNPATPAVGTTTLPTGITLAADCLTTNGDSVEVLFRNLSAATTTQLKAADASTTLIGEAATDDVVAAAGWELLKFVRLTATTMAVYITTFVDAD